MKSTSPRAFRASLKEYMELAKEKPIRIQKRSGESCILMDEDYYEGLLNEITNLQRSLLAANQAITGQTTEYKKGDRSRLKRLSK